MEHRILTVRETAAYLRMNRMTIYRLAQAGKIPAFKVGGSWRFDREVLNRWIEVQQGSAGDSGATNGDAPRLRPATDPTRRR